MALHLADTLRYAVFCSKKMFVLKIVYENKWIRFTYKYYPISYNLTIYIYKLSLPFEVFN